MMCKIQVFGVSQKFCNILVHATLWYMYHLIETIWAVDGSIMVTDINLHGLFNAKAILLEEQQWYNLTHS